MMNNYKCFLFLLPFIFNVITCFGQVLDDTRVIAFLPFENNINDQSGNGLTLTADSGTPAYAEGMFGQALSLNNLRLISTEDSVFKAHEGFTLSVWVRVNNLPSTDGLNQVIMHQTNGPDPGRTHAEILQNGNVPSSYAAGDRLSGPKAVKKKLWLHFALTSDNTTNIRKLYIDGELVDSGQAISEVNFGKITIGANKSGNFFLDGFLDDFLLTTQVLTQKQIRSVITHGVAETLTPNTDPSVYQNPVVTKTRDVDVSYVKGKYWMVQPVGGAKNGGLYKVRSSDDLVNWNNEGRLFQAPPGELYWQGYLFEEAGTVYLYYSHLKSSTNRKSIGVARATTDSITGGFTDLGLLITGEQAIDPYLFKDTDGTFWLYYKGDKGTERGIWVQKMLNPYTKDPSYSPKQLVVPAAGTWEDRGYVSAEGPCIKKYGDNYFLFYTGGPYGQYTYAIGYASSNAPDGIFTKYSGNPIVSNAESPNIFSPGVPTIIDDALGDSWMVYRQRITAARRIERFVTIDKVDRDDEQSGVVDVKGTRGNFLTVPYPLGTEFFIENKATGLRLRPEDGTEGANLIVTSGTATDNWVRWTLESHNNGYFYLRNVQTGDHFRPVDNSNGTFLEQKPDSFQGNRTRWQKVYSSDGYFHIGNEWTKKYFRPASNTVGAKVKQRPDSWAGDWTRWRFVAASSSAPVLVTTQSLPAEAYDHRRARQFMTYPNPFSDFVVFKFRLNETTHGSLQISDFMGTIVKTYNFTNQPQGDYRLLWNGKDAKGNDMPGGMYIYTYKTQSNVGQSVINGRIFKKE